MEGKPIHVRFRNLIPLLLVPPPSQDQLPGFGLGHGRRNHLHYIVPIRDVHQFQLELGRTDPAEVDVTINEARYRELAGQVDDLRARPYVGIDLTVGAYGEDLSVQDGHGLSIGNRVVHRDGLPVVKDQVRHLSGGCRATRPKGTESGNQNRGASKLQPNRTHGSLRKEKGCGWELWRLRPPGAGGNRRNGPGEPIPDFPN